LNHIAGGGLCVLVKLMPPKSKRQDLGFLYPCLFIIIIEGLKIGQIAIRIIQRKKYFHKPKVNKIVSYSRLGGNNTDLY
jgi:hypothetical protein